MSTWWWSPQHPLFHLGALCSAVCGWSRARRLGVVWDSLREWNTKGSFLFFCFYFSSVLLSVSYSRWKKCRFSPDVRAARSPGDGHGTAECWSGFVRPVPLVVLVKWASWQAGRYCVAASRLCFWQIQALFKLKHVAGSSCSLTARCSQWFLHSELGCLCCWEHPKRFV